MKSRVINPRDILQIQTKPIQYNTNMAYSFYQEGTIIKTRRNENYQFVTKQNGAIMLTSTVRTITDNSVLAYYINCIETAIENEELDNACLTLSELLPSISKEISIDDQSYRLMCLYCLYQCVIHLVWHLSISSQAAIRYMEKIVQPVGKSTEDLCWSFTCYANMFMQDQAINILTIVNPPDIKEVLHTDSLYNALIYQLLMHIAGGDEKITGSYGVCASCGNTFFREFKHKKYCKDCDKPSERVKACRAKKRKEAANAQETHP